MRLEARPDVEERAVVLEGVRRGVGGSTVVLHIIPVREIGVLLELIVRAEARMTRQPALTRAAVLPPAGLDAAPNRLPPLKVCRQKRERLAGQLTQVGQHEVGRRDVALMLETRRRRRRHFGVGGTT